VGLAPGVASSSVLPGLTFSGVGAEKQGLQQFILDSLAQQAGQERFDPLMIGQALLGAQQMIPGGSTKTTASAPGTSPFSTLLGLGSLAMGMPGLGLGTLFASQPASLY
jgi:hypothetical protein